MKKKFPLLRIKKDGFIYPFINSPRPAPDIFYLLCICVLAVFGTLMVFSAGYAYAYARYDDGAYFMKRQVIWVLLGFITMIVASRLKPSFYESVTPIIYIGAIILLILVLIIGFAGNGAKRWISIGPFTIQPSEIAKIAIILILAKYFSEYEDLALEKKNKGKIFKYGTLLPAIIMLIPIILVMLQKHLSCIIILGLLGLLMIISSGSDLRYISMFCALGSSGVTALALFTDYTKERITVWRNPEAYKLTGGWQTLQGLMAIGSGGIFGVGYGNSVMKHCYVSEPANDMIFAILCEELGLVGAISVILTFMLLIGRGYIIALRAQNVFSRLTAFGISTKMAIQVLLNIAVVTNTIPNTGISLPFFSYGGSSLIMIFFEMGIMMSISRFSKITK